MPWSKAVGCTVGESGLRGLPGMFLVSVQRAGADGALIRAVGPDVVLGEGDVCWFTGLVESLANVCDAHGLQAVEAVTDAPTSSSVAVLTSGAGATSPSPVPSSASTTGVPSSGGNEAPRDDGPVTDLGLDLGDVELGAPNQEERQLTREQSVPLITSTPTPATSPLSTLQDMQELRAKLETNLRLQQQREAQQGDWIVGGTLLEDPEGERSSEEDGPEQSSPLPPRVLVTPDEREPERCLLLGMDIDDRPGLLHDIAQGLAQLRLQVESASSCVISRRSVSLWRCESLRADGAVTSELLGNVRAVMAALVESTTGVQAVKRRGLAVLRATVAAGSSLVGRSIAASDFRTSYRAAVVAVQRNHRPVALQKIAGLVMKQGDVLVLQVEADSPLLLAPPPQLSMARRGSKSLSRPSFGSIGNLLNLSRDSSLDNMASKRDARDPELGSADGSAAPSNAPSTGLKTAAEVWQDLSVHSRFNALGAVEDGTLHVAPDREFLTAMRVRRGPLVGQSVQASGLRGVPGLFMVSHERVEAEEGLPRTLDPEEALQEADVLWFAGSASAIGDLRKVPGLEPFETEQVNKVQVPLHERRLVQVVVARTGPLCGKKIRELRFRTRFGAAVVAVHREGARVHARVGDVSLMAGDVLLLEAGPAFLAEHPSPDIKASFALIAPIRDSAPPRLRLLVPSLFCAVAMLAVYTAGVAPLLVAALFAAGVMMASGCLSQEEARQAVKWDVYVTIACAFGISTALSNSGLAELCATFLVDVGAASGLGDAGLFIAVYLATFLISNVVTNNAAAALLFPIAMDAAEQAEVDVLAMSYLLMLAASASFMSPFGYQTNLMVFGPGGYKFKDFVTFGLPMQFAQLVVSVVVLSVNVGGVAVWWLVLFLVFVAVTVLRTNGGRALLLLLGQAGLVPSRLGSNRGVASPKAH